MVLEPGLKCGSGEPGSSFCVMTDILYHVPHLCGGFFAIFNELNSKTLKSISVSGGDSWMSNIDLNTFSGNGIFFISTGIENSPIESKAVWSPMLQVERDNRDTIRQVIFFQNIIYVRAYQSNSWGEWKQQ